MGEGEATGIVLKDITNVPPSAPAALDVVRMAVTAESMAGPLSVLSGWLETARETRTAFSPVVLRAMQRQVEQLKRTSAELGAEKRDASSLLLMGDFDLAPVVQEAADILAPRMLETCSQLQFHYSEKPFMMRGDTLLWQHLVGELLESTLRLPGKRQLRFSAERWPQHVTIEIESDGEAAWETPHGGRSHLERVGAAIRAQHGDFEYELHSPCGSRYRLTFPV